MFCRLENLVHAPLNVISCTVSMNILTVIVRMPIHVVQWRVIRTATMLQWAMLLRIRAVPYCNCMSLVWCICMLCYDGVDCWEDWSVMNQKALARKRTFPNWDIIPYLPCWNEIVSSWASFLCYVLADFKTRWTRLNLHDRHFKHFYTTTIICTPIHWNSPVKYKTNHMARNERRDVNFINKLQKYPMSLDPQTLPFFFNWKLYFLA